jgi:hypothetical protein
MMSVSVVLVTLACYHKRGSAKYKLNTSDNMFGLGKNINSVGFHKYNEIVDGGENDEFGTRSGNGTGSGGSRKDLSRNSSVNANRYSKTGDEKKLLFADDDDDDEDDKIFIR